MWGEIVVVVVSHEVAAQQHSQAPIATLARSSLATTRTTRGIPGVKFSRRFIDLICRDIDTEGYALS
jgi:hypothetical protein